MEPATTADRRAHLLKLLALGLVYAGAAKLALMLDAVSGFAAPVWPPTGIALAVLVLGGERLWPAVAAGAFAVNLGAGAPLLAALGVAAGNTLEAVLGARLCRGMGAFQGKGEQSRAVAGYIVVAAPACTLISAAIGVGSLTLAGAIETGAAVHAFRSWWLGDLLAALIVAPALLTWGAEPLGTPIVEAHGGRIWVESQPGRGATFTFLLPRATEAG